MLIEVPASSLPISNEPRERLQSEKVPYLRSDGSYDVSFDSIGDILKAVVAVRYILQGPALLTLEPSLLRDPQETRHLASILGCFFENALSFKEGSLHKVQLDRIKEDKQTEIEQHLSPNIKNFFGQHIDVIEPTGVKVYKIEREKGDYLPESPKIQGMTFVTEYLHRETRLNKGIFCIPIGNFSKEEAELDPYIDFLASQFKEVYLIGAGANWVSTHMTLVGGQDLFL